jgi:hypothetical protein
METSAPHEAIDKAEAIAVIEDGISGIGSAFSLGHSFGVVGAFYLTGLLSEAEYQAYLDRLRRLQAEKSMAADADLMYLPPCGSA